MVENEPAASAIERDLWSPKKPAETAAAEERKERLGSCFTGRKIEANCG